MQRLFVSKRTKAAAIVIAFVLPPLMLGFAYFHAHRPAVHVAGERTVWDYIVMNSDILLGLIFLAACAIPFFLVFEKKKPQARELVPIAVMAALGVVGRTLFSLIPLPNFKPVSAIVIITAVAFGPETGFLTGALTGFLSNFIFGQGPWTPWQMFCWGMIGFVAGLLENRGFFRRDRNRTYFTGSFWTKLCPNGTNRGDLLYFARGITNHASLRLCLYGMATGFAYGWVMNLFFLTYVDPLTWKTALAAYVSSFFFDFCHGLCTFLVLWAVGEPWIAKLNRIKVKFGLIAEDKNYKMPPSQHTAPQAEG